MGEPWFGAKTYGIGLGPKTRAGWISTLVFCAVMLAAPLAELSWRWPAWAIAITLAAASTAFLSLVAVKSSREPMRWRWGGR